MEDTENTEQTPSAKDSSFSDWVTQNCLRQKYDAAALLANTPVYLTALTEVGVGLVIFDFNGGHDDGMIDIPRYYEVLDFVPGIDRLYLESQDKEYLVKPLEAPEAALAWVAYPLGTLTTMSISLADASENFADSATEQAIGRMWWDGDQGVEGSLWVDVKARRVFTEWERTFCESSSEELDLEHLECMAGDAIENIIEATQAEGSEP